MKTLPLPQLPVFESFHQVHVLAAAQDWKQRGEGCAVSFRLSRPWDRFGFSLRHPVNPAACFAEALGFLWAQNDPRVLAYYRVGQLSPMPAWWDNYEMCRMFDDALERLRRDASTTVAVIPATSVSDDATGGRQPRLIALQLLRRAEKVDCACVVRVADIADELPMDVFVCTLAHEFAARAVGFELGTYTHHVTSAFLGAGGVRRPLRHADLNQPAMPTMPSTTTWNTLHLVGDYEDALRRNAFSCTPGDLADSDLAPYWRQVVLLFEVQRQVMHNPEAPIDANVLGALEPVYRNLLARCWPGRMPDSLGAMSRR
ncbi:hypothetical protein [Amycolatopsis sp. NPDC059657]|uniref:hypothetical protein n=1 Tax=Amycolatopsis sp. NPDC059657 TaxID=3346899 RepID=UPI00366AC89D